MKQRYLNSIAVIVCIIFTLTVLSGVGTSAAAGACAWPDHNASISGSQSLLVPFSNTITVTNLVFFPSHPFVLQGSGHSDILTGNNHIITKPGFYRHLDLCILNLIFRN